MAEEITWPLVRVVVADDHELFRQGVSAVLNLDAQIEVVAEAENGRIAVSKCEELSPDVVLMDINMPVYDGLEATRRIAKEFPEIKIIMLTASNSEEMLFEAIQSGASGYVLKQASAGEVIESITRVHRGESVMPGGLALKVISSLSKPANVRSSRVVNLLTQREIEIFRCLGVGMSNRDIGGRLYISESTARNHVRRILEKLHMKNRTQAASYAMHEGFTIEDSGTQ